MMKKAIMYGAGNIGRGFIGQLLSQSGYEVVFLDINLEVIDRLNLDHRYPIRLVGAGESVDVTVEHVRGLDAGDTDAAAAEIASADIMATAVGANILPKIAPVIAAGLAMRLRRGDAAPLNILICENLLNAHKVLGALLEKEMGTGLHDLLKERVGLVEASIARMVPVPTEEMRQSNPLFVLAEPYAELPVDLDGFVGPIPKIVGMKPFSPFAFYIDRKLYMHNMSHAILAYVGKPAGHEFLWQAVRDDCIARIARDALQESAQALSKKYGVPIQQLFAFSEDLMARFDNPALGDTVRRVGRDPMRKLAPGDRLSGAATLCLEQGIVPENICTGIAAALLSMEEERNDLRLDKAIENYCGIDKKNPLYPLIIKSYNKIKNSST